MDSRSVTEMIAQWRDAASDAADAPDPGEGHAGRLAAMRGVLARLGGWRLAGAVVAIAVFVGLAVAVVGPVREAGSPAQADQLGGGAAGTPPESGAAPADVGADTDAEAAPAAPIATDWLAVLSRVDEARGRAYTSGAAEPLSAVFAEGGPALGQEAARVAAIADRGLAVSGWRTEILAVSVVQTPADPADTAELRVRDRRGEYQIGGQGEAPVTVPAAPETDWLVNLRWEDGRWLVESAEPA